MIILNSFIVYKSANLLNSNDKRNMEENKKITSSRRKNN